MTTVVDLSGSLATWYFFIMIGVMFVINIVLLIFIYKDARGRKMNELFWMLFVLFFGLVAIIIYLVVRLEHPKRRK